jgi:uncharacterized protein involved in exopolysaccharide biosynthesis
MNEDEEKQGDEISLLDLFAVFLRYKVVIIVITLVAVIGVVGISLISLWLPTDKSPLPNEYTPSAYMLINDQSSQGGNISSMLNSSGLSSIANLMGVSTSSTSTYSQLAIYLISANPMLDTITDKFNIVSRYKIKKYPRASSRSALKKVLKAEYETESGVLDISFTDKDPVFAQSVVNFAVSYLEQRFNDLGIDKNRIEKDNLEVNINNTYQEILRLEQESHNLERSVGMGNMSGNTPAISLELNRIALELDAQKQIYTQLKIQYELLKVTMSSESPIFQVLEYAEVPDQKSGPSRGKICIIVTFAAFFFSVFLAFVLNAIENIKKDPEAMAKLRNQPLQPQAEVPVQMDKE